MTVTAWCITALFALLLIQAVLLYVQEGQIVDLRADRDEDREKLANLTADMAEQQLLLQLTRTRLLQLANHVTDAEPPSTGRHARIEIAA